MRYSSLTNQCASHLASNGFIIKPTLLYRWQTAGRSCDLISGLISASNTAIPTEVTAASLKRSREVSDDSDTAHRAATFPVTSTSSFPSNLTTGQSSSSGKPSSCELVESSSDTVGLHPSLPSAFDFDFNSFEHGLPLHAEDLGRLPVDYMTGGIDTQAEGARFYTPAEYAGYNMDPYSHTAYSMSNRFRGFLVES